MGIFTLIPALYAYARGFEEIRYVFPLLPILIILYGSLKKFSIQIINHQSALFDIDTQ